MVLNLPRCFNNNCTRKSLNFLCRNLKQTANAGDDASNKSMCLHFAVDGNLVCVSKKYPTAHTVEVSFGNPHTSVKTISSPFTNVYTPITFPIRCSVVLNFVNMIYCQFLFNLRQKKLNKQT